jgi:hypothetical protein
MKKKYSELNGKNIYIASYAMKDLLSIGYAKIPSYNIIEVMNLIKALREMNMIYHMETIKLGEYLYYEFMIPKLIEDDRK